MKSLIYVHIKFGVLGYAKKHCSSVFWNGEREGELQELGNLDFFGLLKTNEHREKVMEEVDKIRSKSVDNHSDDEYSVACKARGNLNIFACFFLVSNSIRIGLVSHPFIPSLPGHVFQHALGATA